MELNKKPKFLALIALHALAMVLVVFLALKSEYTLPDEVGLIQYSGAFKNMLLGAENKPDRKEILLISTTWEKSLIEKNDSNGFPIGNDVITNRVSLGKLLQKLNEKPDNHKFVLMDIFFADSTEQDSLLREELLRTKNIALSYHKKEDGSPEKPVFTAPLGLSDMITDQDMVLKYHIVQGDTLKTMPLVMLEKIDKAKHEHGFMYDFINGKKVLNGFILDYQIRPYDIFEAEDSLRYPMIYISEFLTLPPDMIAKMTKDRIVVVGDFEGSDSHETIYGKMPGPVILLNAYYALRNGANEFDYRFILTMFIAFFIVSYFYFSDLHDKVTEYVEENFLKKNFLLEKFLEFSFLVSYFTLVSVFCYWVFNKHITVMIFVAYFNITDMLKEYLQKRSEAKEAKEKEAKEENEKKTKEEAHLDKTDNTDLDVDEEAKKTK